MGIQTEALGGRDEAWIHSEYQFDRTITLKDGRRLGFADVGNASGAPVIYCHGFPASRKEAALVAAAARRQNVRIVAPDRPGYGLSDWKPARTVGDFAADVRELADLLGLKKFSLLGVSGGGPYALALARLLPARVNAVALVNPLGPVYDPEAVRSMHLPGRFGFTSARQAPWLLWLIYGVLFGPLMRQWPGVALYLLTMAMPAADRLTLQKPVNRTALRESIREALRPGMRGALHDFKLYARLWDFDLGGITVPVTLWYGEADATVPSSHALMLARALPGAKVIRRLGEGHFSLPINHADEILETLVESRAIPS